MKNSLAAASMASATSAPGPQSGDADRLDDEIEGLVVGAEARREAALVAQARAQTLLLQHGLERVVDLGSPAQRLGECGRPDRRDHEFLDVDVGVGVRPAVEDVEHRHRQQIGVRAAQVAEQRKVGGVGCRLGHRERDAEQGVGAEAAFVRSRVEVDQQRVDETLLAGLDVAPDELRADRVEHGGDGLADALAAVAFFAVAQFDRLERAGRRAAWHRGPAQRAVGEGHLDLDGGVTARIEDLARSYGIDRRHGIVLPLTGMITHEPNRRPWLVRTAPPTHR